MLGARSSDHDLASSLPPIVLVIEDDPDTREMYELVLTQEGFWASGAADTHSALDAARDLRPDVIVTDIGLPGEIDVFAMVRRLRAQEATRHIPVIAVTGQQVADGPGVPRFAQVLVKPVAPDQLSAHVRATLARCREVRERAARIRARVPRVLRRSQSAVQRSQAPADSRPGLRRCPKCAAELRHTETRTLQAATFDYFEPCPSGCGLFCYDRGQRRMITIIS